MSKRFRVGVIFLCFFCLFSLSGCTDQALGEVKGARIDEADTEGKVEVEEVAKAPIEEGNLKDNKELYEDSDPSSVITMYLTVSKGNKADGSDHTWEEINTYSAYDYENMGVDRYKVEGILNIDETGKGLDGSSYGFGEEVPNVSVQVRGQTSSKSAQKNFKIRIKDGKEKFRGQRTLNINKHRAEPYRFVNKMCYDLLDPIPQLIGGRTQFVHLYVKDQTQAGDDEFHDYGLYTMVEQVNKTYLKHHGLDENGHLYKVTFFEWDKYDAIMASLDDPEFDKKAFERYLEIKGEEDPTKLQRVVEEIHNYSIPIEKIVDEHFDAENICYWMAFNILIGNYDVGARNLFLYSPLNSEKFYMICWDMDASFKTSFNLYKDHLDGISWEQGMTKFLGLELINRMMKEDKYREMLDDAVEDLHKNYVTRSIVEEKVNTYKPITEEYVLRMPDVENAQLDELDLYDELISKIPAEVDDNYRIYKESMEKPWPFFVDAPEVDSSGNLTFSWGVSYDHKGEEITYNYVLATDIAFENVVDHGEGLSVPLVTRKMLPSGTYYFKVYSRNESGKTMDCFDYLKYPGRGKAYGCYGFTIDNDGTITALK
ncbi:MAG: CotH kinase family protein [Lachnospiraceae bacterium]|nr:CotH kinase family protein [Lachnospiraceae bacterium]